jgi:8-oxo-dGTP diphosphatase
LKKLTSFPRPPEGRGALGARVTNQPRVRVAALIVLDGSVVLVRHRAGSSVYHLLPGGGVDYRETLEHAVVREVLEETGLEVTLGQLLFASDTIDPHGTRHVINLTFLANAVGGAITQRPEDRRVEAVDLVAPADLSSLDLRPPIAAVVEKYVRTGHIESGYLGSLFTEGR